MSVIAGVDFAKFQIEIDKYKSDGVKRLTERDIMTMGYTKDECNSLMLLGQSLLGLRISDNSVTKEVAIEL